MQRGGLDSKQVLIDGHVEKCLKIIKDLKGLSSSHYVTEDAGFESVANYDLFIPHPVSLGSIWDRLHGKGKRGVVKYTYLNDFATDVRRVFGNFARYNWYADKDTIKMRKDVMKILFKFELLWYEYTKELDAATPGMMFKMALPELKWCFTAFDDTVKVNVGGKFFMDDFIHPINNYYPPGTPDHKEYHALVSNPISFAEIVSKFAEAEYATLDDVKDDLNLLVTNCAKFWSQQHRAELGQAFINNAMKLQEAFLKSLNASEQELIARPTSTGPASLIPRFVPVVPAPVLTLKATKGGTKKGAAAAGPGAAAAAASGAVGAALGAVGGEGAVMYTLDGRERAPWELAAETVWKAITKHAYVDVTKPTCIADFWRPIVMVEPAIAADYLAVIAHPMDLTTLYNELNAGSVTTPQQFVDLLVTIFQNAIDYNSGHKDSSYATTLCPRCLALRRYCYWLSLETLPVEDDEATASSKAKSKATLIASTTNSPLTITAQATERKARETVLSEWFIADTGGSPYTECNKLLKDLQRARNKAEGIQISYFQIPVNVSAITDYTVYVRNPTDLATIRYRLDGTLPTSPQVAQMIDRSAKRYIKYGEFVTDLRRCFTNAIKYNSAHLASDTTGISQLVVDAAKFLQERLEGLLPMFTVQLCERVDKARISNEENQLRMAEERAKREKEEAEAKKFEQRVLEELKATDLVFAADYDLEQKRKLTELQMKEHQLQQQRAMLEATAAATAASMEDLGRDIAPDDTSTGGAPAAAGASLSAPVAGALLGTGAFANADLLRGLHVPPFPGFGQNGKVPGRYAHLVELKKSVRERAWAFYAAAPGTVTQSNSGGAGGVGRSAAMAVKVPRRDSGTVRLVDTSQPAATTATADAGPSATQSTTGNAGASQEIMTTNAVTAAEQISTGTAMDIESASSCTAVDSTAVSEVTDGEGGTARKGPTRFSLSGARITGGLGVAHKRQRLGRVAQGFGVFHVGADGSESD